MFSQALKCPGNVNLTFTVLKNVGKVAKADFGILGDMTTARETSWDNEQTVTRYSSIRFIVINTVYTVCPHTSRF